MRHKSNFIYCLFLFFAVVLFIASTHQENKWQGTIEKENGISVIKNPIKPLYGEITFELEEDLSIGNDSDDNFLFYRIRDITVDDLGNIFVGDMSNFRIQKFDKNGNYLQTIGTQGQGPGEFERPTKIRIDTTTGNIYVKDGTYDIEIFDKQGNPIKGFKIEKSFSDFSLDEDGNIIGIFRTLSESSQTNSVCKIDSVGKIYETYAEFPYNMFRQRRSGGSILIVTTGWEKELYISKINNQTFVYGHPEEYELSVIDESGQLLFKIKKDEPRRKFPADQRNRLKKYNFGEFQPFFYLIFTDSKERIYVQTNKTWGEDEVKEKVVDIFSKNGYYLYKTSLPKQTYIIKNGFVYAHIIDEDEGLEMVKRLNIKNWDQIKEGIK